MSDLGDPTCWTDREREFFAAGWNECLKMQPGENGRLRGIFAGLRKVWFGGVDLDKDAISQATLSAIIEAERGCQQIQQSERP